jgi:uncharacterized membrane-anchored protein
MKKIIFFITAGIVLAAVPVLIIQKETTLADGRTMLLHLAPRDPRSLMQGDYMVLRYRMAREVPHDQLQSKGTLVVKLDANNVASFVRVHKDEPLAEGEYLLAYRKRGELRLGAESFMFQEGHASLYDRARFGELKVDKKGSSVLAGLCDSEFKPLRPPTAPQSP